LTSATNYKLWLPKQVVPDVEGYDVIIIGAGHNGSHARHLARAGKKVLVSAPSRVGGAAV
jgi:ribulose 1,5-bisphosphate synthetase/thiazole synthase